MSGYAAGGQYDDGYGHPAAHGDSYYQDEHAQGYYDNHQEGYYDNGYGTQSQYCERDPANI
jgi:1,3-beta-glucan synthase